MTDEQAFRRFYDREHAAQVRRSYLMIGSNEAANDIVHEAMLQVYRRWGEVKSPGAYLNRAVLNGCRDQDVAVPENERTYFESLTPERQQAYDSAATNECQDAADQVLHESALSSELSGDASESRMWDAQQMALLDPRVRQAQTEWHGCVVTAVSDDEPTPNDLARKYLFEGGDPARSGEVAIADFECQQQVDLEGVWYRTVTEYERSLMGADVGLYDDQARLLQQTVDLARQELADRNIEVPTID